MCHRVAHTSFNFGKVVNTSRNFIHKFPLLVVICFDKKPAKTFVLCVLRLACVFLEVVRFCLSVSCWCLNGHCVNG